MFGKVNARFSARSCLSRAAAGAILALWCVFALASGDARAFCLDFGGGCSPSAAAPVGPCHDQAPDGGDDPSCTSCVDILIHGDALAAGSLSDQELQAPAAAHLPGGAGAALLASAENLAATAASLIQGTFPHPAGRTAVLRI
jgi:hypothetical protein